MTEKLNSEKCIIEKTMIGTEERYLVTFSLTREELMALHITLNSHPKRNNPKRIIESMGSLLSLFQDALIKLGSK